MNAFCASVNFDAIIAFHSFQPGKLGQKTLPQSDPAFTEQSSVGDKIKAKPSSTNYSPVVAWLRQRISDSASSPLGLGWSRFILYSTY
jgi:hypothetical protein